MATVWIPALLRDLTGEQEQVSAPGGTLGQVVDALDVAYPGIAARLCQGGRLDPAMSAFVDGRIARLGLREAVKEESQVQFLPAIGGG